MPDQIPAPAAEQSKKPIRVMAMPEKFYIEDKGGGGGKKNNFLLIGIIILVVAILGLGAYFFITKTGNKNDDQNTNIPVNTNTTNLANNTNKTNKNTNNNVNSATNLNSNLQNINLFSNFNTNSNANASSNINSSIVPSSLDTDADGLTDIEETLYGTNPNNPDTDGDGYSDGQEVTTGYDPNGPVGKRLDSTTTVRLYSDSQEDYSILYPAAWIAGDDPQNTRGKMFSTNGEFIEVSVQENPARLSARDWYLTKSPGVDSSRILSVTNWDKTLVGVLSLDQRTVYFTKNDKAYVLNYNINILTQANYKSTFQMMYGSFGILSSQTNTNSATSINSNINTNTNTNSNANRNLNTNTNTNNLNRL